MKKSIMSILISVTLLFMTAVPVLASETPLNEDSIEQQAYQLAYEIPGVEVLPASSVSNMDDLLEVNTIDELEELLRALAEGNTGIGVTQVSYPTATTRAVVNKVAVLRKTGQQLPGIAAGILPFTQVITVNYQMNGLDFVKMVSVSSNIEGLAAVTWVQQTYSHSVLTRREVSVTAYGYYVIGVTIQGLPVGYTINSSFTNNFNPTAY